MGRRLAGVIGIGVLSLAIAACGGGSKPSDDGSVPSSDKIVACLAGAGLTAEPVDSGTEAEVVGAQAPNGDVVIVINLPKAYESDSETSEEITRMIQKELRSLGRGGLMTTNTVNHGTTYIGVLGVKGVAGGLASAEIEILAKQCATK